jgi:hypothetical protein
MQEITHSELVNKVRNCEGAMVFYIIDEEGEGDGFCVNPTEDMKEQMRYEASEDLAADEEIEVALPDEPVALDTENTTGATTGDGGSGQAPVDPDSAA